MFSLVSIRLKSKKIATIFLAYLFFSCKAYAIGFGDITLYSYLNDPLSAEIELINLDGIALSDLHVAITPLEDFMLVGATQALNLNRLKFKVITAQNKSVVYLWTNDVVQDPIVEFLLNLQWPAGKIVKAFTMFLDVPEINGQPVEKKTPLILSAEYQKSLQNSPPTSDIKVNFPYDEKLAKKLNSTAAAQPQYTVTIPQHDGSPQNLSINSSLTKSGASLKDLSDGFAVPENELLTPEVLKTPVVVQDKALLNPSAATAAQANLPKVIEPVEQPVKHLEVPKPIEPPALLPPASTAAATAKSLPSAAPVAAQQISLQPVPNIKETTVVKEQDIKVVTKTPELKLQPQLPQEPKPNLSNLLNTNEKQVANTVIQKYKFEIIFTFLFLVGSLVLVVKMLRYRQISREAKQVDDASPDEETLQDVAKEPVPGRDESTAISELVTKEADISVTPPLETIASSESVEEVKIEDVVPTPEAASSASSTEATLRLNLASQYIEAGDITSAKEILTELIKTADGADKLKAERLLGTIIT